jgi:hypothetical protein
LSSLAADRTVPAGNQESFSMKTNLTKQQLHDLAILVFEQNGCLTGDELDEQIALLLEDVAGFETATPQSVRRVINQIRSHYHVASNEPEDN